MGTPLLHGTSILGDGVSPYSARTSLSALTNHFTKNYAFLGASEMPLERPSRG